MKGVLYLLSFVVPPTFSLQSGVKALTIGRHESQLSARRRPSLTSVSSNYFFLFPRVLKCALARGGVGERRLHPTSVSELNEQTHLFFYAIKNMFV